MKETQLNSFLVKSLKEAFVEHMIEVRKHPGNQYSEGYPDLEGTLKGLSFHIEGKMGKIQSRKSKLALAGDLVFSNHSFSELQIATMERLHASGALVLVAIYLGVRRSRRMLLLSFDMYREEIKNNKFSKQQYEILKENAVDYHKQRFLIRDIFSELWKEHKQTLLRELNT